MSFRMVWKPPEHFWDVKNGGVFDVQSMIVMSEKSIFHGLEVSRPFRGCLDLKGFSILDR